MASPPPRPITQCVDNHLHRFLNSRLPSGRLEIAQTDKSQLLSASESDLLTGWLSDEERVQLSHYTFTKRRTEWLLGRICAKQAVLNLLERFGIEAVDPAALRIEANPSGRPFITFPDRLKLETVPDISISHSGGKALGVACTCCCGVDIQILTETLSEVRDWFCSATETTVLESSAESDLLGLGMLWTAKEAVRKCLNIPNPVGFKDMRLIGVSNEDRYRLFDLQVDEPAGIGTVPVVIHVEGDYCLGFCTLNKGWVNA